jgi:hypothetical protein
MNIVFFKRPKPRQFNYVPRYYDPEKEEAEARRKARNSPQDMDPGERMRAEIRRRWRTDRKEADPRNKLFKIIFYAIIAGFFIYMIFFTEFINHFVSLFLR